MIKAFAVKRNNQIVINSIFETKRGAMINGLVSQWGIPVLDTWSDEIIENLFNQLDATVVEIDITESV